MPLTIKEVKHAKPGRHSDGGGLYLLVKPKIIDGVATQERASASWVLRVQSEINGKPERRDFGLGTLTLDPIPADIPLERRKLLTLTEAREKARLGRALAKAGINPAEHWRAAPEEQASHTFKEVAEARHKGLKAGWKNGKHKEQWLNTLERYAFPTLGSLDVNAVDAAAIEKVLMPIWLSKPETARRVKQRIGAVLDYAHAKGWRSSEAPMRAVDATMRAIKQPKRGNFAAMPYKDLPGLMARLRAEPFSVGRAALQFLILNPSRTGNVRSAQWSEFDLDAAEWRIPGEKMKAGETHIVPLCQASVSILKELMGLFAPKPNDLVFPGLKGPMSDATIAKAFRLAGGGVYTVHGLRSTFRDWAADNGFNNDWAEAALAHSIAGQEGKTVAAYKRTTYFEHRRDKLMPAWASFALGDDSNIVRLAVSQ